MAAPTITSRATPTGWKMPDGYRTEVSILGTTNVSFWEKQVKPPGIDGGEAIDTTTMFNDAWRTKHPRSLKTLEPIQIMAAFDPDVYAQIFLLINKNTSITVHLPDNSTISFYGAMIKFEPSEFKEGEEPTCAVTIVPTNWDPVNFLEVGPVFTAATGT